MYKKFIDPLLSLRDAEKNHELVMGLTKFLSNSPVRQMIERLYKFEHECLRIKIFGIDFQNPVGLAAGFDKDGRALRFLPSLGFGFLEIGTVTPQAQEGNPKPRLFRLNQDQALVNRMGFNNRGVYALAERLGKLNPRETVLGINIGKNKSTPNENAALDYEKCFEVLAIHSDYMVVNVSSPNAPNLRELQNKTELSRLLARIKEKNLEQAKPKPILLKIAPDLSESQLNDIIEVVQSQKIDGIIATNATLSREGLRTSADRLQAIGQGGLSGKPVKDRSTEIIRYIFKKTNGSVPIIGVGGVFSARDAYEKITAGASLIQIFTGFIYEGPGLIKKIKKGLVRCLARDGFSSIKQAVGSKSGL